MMVILVILAFVAITAIEAPGLVKDNMWRELAAFAAFIVLGMGLCIPLALGLAIPSPNLPLEIIFKPLAQWLTPK